VLPLLNMLLGFSLPMNVVLAHIVPNGTIKSNGLHVALAAYVETKTHIATAC
jgi:hypothetical protein